MKNQFGDDFMVYFYSWVYSTTITECEEKWKDMKEKFGVDETVDCWLSTMYHMREQWVDAYLKDTFWAE